MPPKLNDHLEKEGEVLPEGPVRDDLRPSCSTMEVVDESSHHKVRDQTSKSPASAKYIPV